MTAESAQWQGAAVNRPPPAQAEKRQQIRVSGVGRRRLGATVEAVSSPRSLGWLSIGLGAAALLAPRPLATLTGLSAHSGLLPFVGLRELASGFGLLTQADSTPWLWSRVVGDMMDLAVISSALQPSNAYRSRALGTAGVVAAIAAVDVAAAIVSSSRRGSVVAAGPFSASLIVNKTPQECYDFWRDVSNLPRFSSALDSVAQIDEQHARWMLRGALSSGVTLTVKTTTDEAGKRIAWHSVGRSDLAHAGVVRFEAAPGNRGTLVGASLWYRPPGGKAGLRIGKLVGADPRSRLREDLRRFKQLIETGEVATTRGQPSGRRSFFGRRIPEGRLSRQRI
jgi:uncharacterized membrane protein